MTTNPSSDMRLNHFRKTRPVQTLKGSYTYVPLAGRPATDYPAKALTSSISRSLPLYTTSSDLSIGVSTTDDRRRSIAHCSPKATRCLIRQIEVAILLLDKNVCRDEPGSSGEEGRKDVGATEKEKLIIGENSRDGLRYRSLLSSVAVWMRHCGR